MYKRQVSYARADLVNDLLLSGSRVDAKDKSADQALSVAVRLGHLGVIRVLLRAGACPGTRGKVSRTDGMGTSWLLNNIR